MNTKLLLPVALISALALAACDNKPAAPANTESSTPAAAAPAAAPAAPAAEAAPAAAPAATPAAPAADAGSAMQAMQQQIAAMTPEQKQQTITAARKAAEDAATAQGLTADQVKQAGDLAEQAAKQTLGVQ